MDHTTEGTKEEHYIIAPFATLTDNAVQVTGTSESRVTKSGLMKDDKLPESSNIRIYDCCMCGPETAVF
jgi:hypothetical protein